MPFLILVVSMAGLLIGAEGSEEAVGALFAAAPCVAQTLEPVLREVTSRSSGEIGRSQWSGRSHCSGRSGRPRVASSGIEAIRVGLDRAHDVTSVRGLVRRRLIAIGFVFLAFATFATLAILIIFAP